jgi:hypothetical protein
VDYVLGLARNQRLGRIIRREMWEASSRKVLASRCGFFVEFSYRAKKTKGAGTGSGGWWRRLSRSRARRTRALW